MAEPKVSPAAVASGTCDAALAARLDGFDVQAQRRAYHAQGEFLFVDDFLPPAMLAALVAVAQAGRGALNRNYVPGHKKGGSLSRHSLDACAPAVAALYRSRALIDWLDALTGKTLLPSPASDPHAYALYYYTEAGDHIGWHYDTSYYKGSRYTVLLGVIDRSSCALEYRLHTREPGRTPEAGRLALKPGALVVFDGDKLQHRITPAREGEERVSLTLEYVTDPRMGRAQQLFSNLKDAVGYFGFKQVFRRRGTPP